MEEIEKVAAAGMEKKAKKESEKVAKRHEKKDIEKVAAPVIEDNEIEKVAAAFEKAAKERGSDLDEFKRLNADVLKHLPDAAQPVAVKHAGLDWPSNNRRGVCVCVCVFHNNC